MTKRLVIKNAQQAIDYLNGFDWFENLKIENDVIVESAACPRCGGSGYIQFYRNIKDGVCFECGGSNTLDHIKHTPIVEYARETRKRINRNKKASEKRLAKIKEREEKKLNGQRNWCEKNGFGRITFDEKRAIEEKRREEVKKLSQHVGEVGDRIEIAVKIVAVPNWETAYGYQRLYILIDENNNKYIWKTSTVIDGRPGDTIVIKGTIKDHNEREGEKQTVLIRCKQIISK